MRTAVAAILVLASLGLPTPSLRAQQRSPTEPALSFTSGSAFDGSGIGMAGTSFASSSASWYESGYGADRYGVYDGGGWGSPIGYRGYSHGYHAYGRYRCADVWSILDGPYYGAVQAGFYDDWFYFSDLYYDCVLRGPSWVYHRYHSYRPYHVSLRPFRPFRPRAVYISIAIVDPFWPAWGPFHAYDPWGWYWSNWIVYRSPRVRTVYVSPPVYRRPSPIYVAGATFKEDPRGGAEAAPPRRTAMPRDGAVSVPAASAPAAARDGNGIQAPPRRGGPVSGRLGGNTPSDGATTREGTRSAEPRGSGEAAGRPAAPAAPGPSGGSPRPSAGRAETQPQAPSSTNDTERTRRGGGSVVQPGGGRPSDVVRPGTSGSTAQPQSEPERQPTVERLPSTTRRGAQNSEQPSEQPAEPALVELIEPRRDPQWTTAPRVQPQPARPSDARSGTGANARSAPAGSGSANGGQPSGARQVPERTVAPEARPAPSREAQPERQAEPAHSREVERPSREVQPPSREVQPPQRQPEPQPQAREAPSRPASPPPATREAPSRPSSPPTAQAAPAPSASGGGRPAPAPRRPGGERQ